MRGLVTWVWGCTRLRTLGTAQRVYGGEEREEGEADRGNPRKMGKETGR